MSRETTAAVRSRVGDGEPHGHKPPHGMPHQPQPPWGVEPGPFRNVLHARSKGVFRRVRGVPVIAQIDEHDPAHVQEPAPHSDPVLGRAEQPVEENYGRPLAAKIPECKVHEEKITTPTSTVCRRRFRLFL